MITLTLVKRLNAEKGYSTALLERGYLTSFEIPQLMKRTMQIDEKNHFIDTNLLANMDILNLHGSGFRTVGVSTCPQFDPRKTPIPWTMRFFKRRRQQRKMDF